ncbi:MAG: CAP domain-containing protein [Burkholderiales bacterium]
MTTNRFSGWYPNYLSARQFVVAAALASMLTAAAFDDAPAHDDARTLSWIASAQAATKVPALSTGDAVVIQASDGNHYYATVDRLYRERGIDMVAFSWQAGNRFGQGYMPLRTPGGGKQNPKLLSVDAARSQSLTISNDLASTKRQQPGGGASGKDMAAATSGTSANAAQGAQLTFGPLNAAERNGALAAHAAWRREVGVGPLAWSDSLATSAQDWAEHIREDRSCRVDASAHSQRADIGENLAYYSPMRMSNGKTRQQAIEPARVVDDWGQEKRFYDRASNRCSGVCGHYTQVVWQDTQAVGCGRAVCEDQSQVWVCQYSPPGNYTGQKPY